MVISSIGLNTGTGTPTQQQLVTNNGGGGGFPDPILTGIIIPTLVSGNPQLFTITVGPNNTLLIKISSYGKFDVSFSCVFTAYITNGYAAPSTGSLINSLTVTNILTDGTKNKTDIETNNAAGTNVPVIINNKLTTNFCPSNKEIVLSLTYSIDYSLADGDTLAISITDANISLVPKNTLFFGIETVAKAILPCC